MSSRAVAPTHPPKPARDWRTYTLAQTQEGLLFENLVWDLLQGVPEPEYRGNGRPPLALRDVLFVALTKAYTGLSSRRHQGMMEKAVEQGMLRKPPHFNAVSKLLRQEFTYDVLRCLVQASALPMSCLEADFAVDSTGFATGLYGSYREARYGKTVKADQRLRKWVKLHAICGVRTNVVTAATVLDGHSGDSPQFAGLVEATAQHFPVREVSADKAYSSKANLWHVQQIGGDALIPFKKGKVSPEFISNVRNGRYHGAPGMPGSARLWRKAFAYFLYHQDEFNARYHKRSNVESTFGAIKARFGERLKARDFQAQRNEVLCKVVAWNVCVLVRAMHEHGIPADFTA